MKLSDTLFAEVEDLWKEAAGKPFVREMAKGTLDEDCFRHYMIQDYLYLQDYMDILNLILANASDPGLRDFLHGTIEETKNETERVHVPNMRKIGIRDEELSGWGRESVIIDYVGYMKRQLEEKGILAGLTAMLQCSWAYAYIGKTLTEEYPDDIAASPYHSWFEAYTCGDYVSANQKWIDVLDRETGGISSGEAEKLGQIFRTCAEYENRLWDDLYSRKGGQRDYR